MAFKLGAEGKVYYKVGGQSGGGAWLELTNVRDVTASQEAGDADATTRGNASTGFMASIPTLKDASVDFEMVWDTSDAGFTAIKNAFYAVAAADKIIGLEVFDGDRTDGGTQGLRGDFAIPKFDRSEPLNDLMKVAVTAKLAYSDTPPSWVTI